MACVIDYNRSPHVLLCTICKGTAPFPLPMTISQTVLIITQFEKQHENCRLTR